MRNPSFTIKWQPLGCVLAFQFPWFCEEALVKDLDLSDRLEMRVIRKGPNQLFLRRDLV